MKPSLHRNTCPVLQRSPRRERMDKCKSIRTLRDQTVIFPDDEPATGVSFDRCQPDQGIRALHRSSWAQCPLRVRSRRTPLGALVCEHVGPAVESKNNCFPNQMYSRLDALIAILRLRERASCVRFAIKKRLVTARNHTAFFPTRIRILRFVHRGSAKPMWNSGRTGKVHLSLRPTITVPTITVPTAAQRCVSEATITRCSPICRIATRLGSTSRSVMARRSAAPTSPGRSGEFTKVS
jgi:hypothetical protein